MNLLLANVNLHLHLKKINKNEDRKAAGKGDCIDCLHCVQVCPTGIDIRNGTQLECTNCTACIDACDHMMDAVGQDKGLVRFVSEEGIKTRKPFQWTRRVKAYSILLLALFVTLIVLIATRKDFQTTLIRQRGSTYQMDELGHITNIYEVNLLNKTTNLNETVNLLALTSRRFGKKKSDLECANGGILRQSITSSAFQIFHKKIISRSQHFV